MKVSEYFTSKRRESQTAVDALAEHEKGYPGMMTEYNKLDKKCIELAREVGALQVAGSPRLFAAQAELLQARRTRDYVKATFSRQRDQLLRQVESFTRDPIADFHQAALDRIRGLSARYRFSRLETLRNGYTDKVTVRISTNSNALHDAQDRILTRLKEIREMQRCSLQEVQEKIAEVELEFNGLDTSSMIVEEVPESTATMMKPSNPTTELYNDKLANLSGRLSALEGR